MARIDPVIDPGNVMDGGCPEELAPAEPVDPTYSRGQVGAPEQHPGDVWQPMDPVRAEVTQRSSGKKAASDRLLVIGKQRNGSQRVGSRRFHDLFDADPLVRDMSQLRITRSVDDRGNALSREEATVRGHAEAC